MILFHPYKLWICEEIWHPRNLKRNHTNIFKCRAQQNPSINDAQEVRDIGQKDCYAGNDYKNHESTEPSRLFSVSFLTRCSHQYKIIDKSHFGGKEKTKSGFYCKENTFCFKKKKKFTTTFENTKPCESLNSIGDITTNFLNSRRNPKPADSEKRDTQYLNQFETKLSFTSVTTKSESIFSILLKWTRLTDLAISFLSTWTWKSRKS